jgi:hypothetical protein
MQQGNYCTHAIEQLREAMGPRSAHYTLISKEDEGLVDEIIGLLGNAIKFVLPENAHFYEDIKDSFVSISVEDLPEYIKKDKEYLGNLNDEEWTQVTFSEYEISSWHLPYETVAFEFKNTFSNVYKEFGPCNCIALIHKNLLFYFWQERSRMWGIFPYALRVSNDFESIQQSKQSIIPVLPGMAESGGQKGYHGAIGEFGSIVKILAQTFAFMRCNNVYVKNNLAPKRLNKSRKKKGKLPLFEYKTLEVRQSNGVVVTTEEHVRTRNSPRIHLRRGHIRTYADGSSTYVVPCVVGSKERGVVHKQYEVHK